MAQVYDQSQMSNLDFSAEYVSLSVSDGTELRSYSARPLGTGPFPSLIVLQEAFGVNEHIRDVTRRFAALGYVAIAPELYHRSAPGFECGYDDFSIVLPHYQALTNDGLTADLQASYDWLLNINPGQPVASIGYCLGGRVAFLSAITLPVACAVSYYGGGIAPNQMSAGLLDRAKEVRAPLLLNWGGKDKHLGPDQVRAVTDALDAAEKDYVNVVYSKGDHGFACDARAAFHEESATLALAVTQGFFKQHLG